MPSARRTNRSGRPAAIPPPIISSFANEPCGHRYAALGGAPAGGPPQPALPKHFPFSGAAPEDDLLFEFLTTLFCVYATGLQFVHMYRTVWWLPHSHNNFAVNLYLIDGNLAVFIVVILSRRLMYLTGCKILDKISYDNRAGCYLYYKWLLFGFVFVSLSLCTYRIMHNHQIEKILYLCYPFVIYSIFFGFKIDPFFELEGWVTLSTPPPLHACSSIPGDIRDETETLIKNFNYRMKEILFSTILNAYYAGFIPCCFAQPAVYYDTLWATQHIIFIFLSSFIGFFVHIISVRYCDILHRASLHLGVWEKVETGRTMLLVNNTWKEDFLWPYGALVKYGRDIWRAQGDCNCSEPGNVGSRRFYHIFRNPTNNLSMLVIVQLTAVAYQLILLVNSTLWHNILSLTLMLLFNYYVLYRLFRDYLISHKVYVEEREMHKKIYMR